MGLDEGLVPLLVDLFDGDLLESAVVESARALGAAAAISGMFDRWPDVAGSAMGEQHRRC